VSRSGWFAAPAPAKKRIRSAPTTSGLLRGIKCPESTVTTLEEPPRDRQTVALTSDAMRLADQKRGCESPQPRHSIAPMVPVAQRVAIFQNMAFTEGREQLANNRAAGCPKEMQGLQSGKHRRRERCLKF
jgi:hypothetical protein